MKNVAMCSCCCRRWAFASEVALAKRQLFDVFDINCASTISLSYALRRMMRKVNGVALCGGTDITTTRVFSYFDDRSFSLSSMYLFSVDHCDGKLLLHLLIFMSPTLRYFAAENCSFTFSAPEAKYRWDV